MKEDEFSTRDMHLAPLKASAALGFWASMGENRIKNLDNRIGVDYTAKAEAKENRDRNDQYDIHITLNSNSRNFEQSLRCFKNLPKNTAKGLIQFFKEEEWNIARFVRRSRPSYAPFLPQISRFPYVIATNPIISLITDDEEQKNALVMNDCQTENHAELYMDVEHLLKKKDTDLSPVTRRLLKRYVNREEKKDSAPVLYASQIVGICIETQQIDGFQKKDGTKESLVELPHVYSFFAIEPGGAYPITTPLDEDENPSGGKRTRHTKASQRPGPGIKHIVGSQNAVRFAYDMNRLMMMDRDTTLTDLVQKGLNQRQSFLFDKWKDTPMTWDTASAKTAPMPKNKAFGNSNFHFLS